MTFDTQLEEHNTDRDGIYHKNIVMFRRFTVRLYVYKFYRPQKETNQWNFKNEDQPRSE